MSILVIFDVNSDTALLSSTTESVAETVAVELGEGTSAVPVAGSGALAPGEDTRVAVWAGVIASALRR